MKLTLIGAGAGTAADLTGQARRALEIADVVTGSARLLAALPEFVTARRAPARTAEEMLRALTGAAAPCAVFSGDAGFYSGAAALLNAWPGEWEVAPGVSSLSALAARLGRPWQGWRAVSAHGAACDPVWQVCQGAPVFFLTGREGFAPLCRQLAAAGLGALPAAAGWNLGLADEGVRTATVAALAREPERPLSVLLVDPAPGARPGILPLDDEFVRGRVPMTRLEIRAAALARLRIRPGEVAWDVGAGTGGMAVTLARAGARVYAVERNPAALQLLEHNRQKLGAFALRIVPGAAPAALADLPRPDAAFVGGSGGRMEEIIAHIARANPRARVAVTAATLETLPRALAALETHFPGTVETCQIAVSRAGAAGAYHLLRGENPVFLLTGGEKI